MSSVPDPEIVLKGGVILHVGLPLNGDDPRKRLREGGKLIWVMTEEEAKGFARMPGEDSMIWKSDDQIRRLLHDKMGLWEGAEVLGPEGRVAQLAGIMGDLASLHNFNVSSDKMLSKDDLPTRNTIRNWRWHEDGLPLSVMRGRGVGRSAVVIAAGPSLNGQWAYLRKFRETRRDIPFIVAGRTYKKAVQEGVHPDFVVEVEQYEWDADLFMFAPEPHKDCILAFPITAAAKLPKVWPGLKLCLLNHYMAQLMGLKVGEESVDGGNSVLHYEVTMAGILGCDPIYLAGVDFGYPKGTEEDTHATGTFHAWPSDVQNLEHTHQQGLELPANDGGTVKTSPAYKNFGTYLSVQVEKLRMQNPALKVYSFSERGLKISGVEYMNIEEAIKSA